MGLLRYTNHMQCLRCPNEAIPGKALCASCFADHQEKLEFEGSDEWVEEQLATTRDESRGQQREARGAETSPQSLVLTLAPALLALGGLTMLSVWFVNNVGFKFTPTPESKQSQGVADGSAVKSPEKPMALAHSQTPAQDKPVPAAIAEGPRGGADYQAPELTATPVPEPSATPTNTANPTSTPTPIFTESPRPLS